MPSLSERHGPFPVYQPYSAAAPAQETKRNLHAAQAVNNFASAGLAQYNASQNGAPSLRTAALSSAHSPRLTFTSPLISLRPPCCLPAGLQSKDAQLRTLVTLGLGLYSAAAAIKENSEL